MARSETLRQVRQARALCLAADRVANAEIARRCEVSVPTVRDWRARFAESGVEGLGEVRRGRGRRPQIPSETVEAIVHDTLNQLVVTATENLLGDAARHSPDAPHAFCAACQPTALCG